MANKVLLIIIFLFFTVTNAEDNTEVTIARVTPVQIVLPDLNTDLAKLIKNPKHISDIYQRLESSIKAQLGSEFAELNQVGLKLVVATIISYRLKPYGPSISKTLKEFLKSKDANCANYPRATVGLFEILQPKNKILIDYVGWNGGVIGNHVQMFVEQGTGVPLMLDPTVGIIAIGTFNQVAGKKSIPASSIATAFIQKPNEYPEITSFHDNIIKALHFGEYNPSDLLYYYSGYKEWTKGAKHWATPQYYKLKKT